MRLHESLKAYIDGELTPSERRDIEDQLRSNPALERELEDLRRLSRLLKDDPTQVQPVGLESTLITLRRSERRARNRLVFQWGLSLAAIVLVVSATPRMFAQMKNGTSGDLARAEVTRTPSIGSLAKSPPITNSNGVDLGSDAAANRGRMPADAKVQVTSTPRHLAGESRDSDGTVAPAPATPPVASVDQQASASPAALANRLIEKTGTLALDVKDVSKSMTLAEGMVRKSGGYIENSGRNSEPGGRGVATLTARIPEQRFGLAMDDFRSLGDVTSEQVGGEDVTGSVVDTEAKLKVLKGEESQYLTLLGRTRTVGQVLEVKDKLSEVRQEIESLDSERKVLRGQAKLSTIAVSMREKSDAVVKKPAGNWAAESWNSATDGLHSALQGLATAGITLFVYSPIWIPIAFLGWLLWKRSRFQDFDDRG